MSSIGTRGFYKAEWERILPVGEEKDRYREVAQRVRVAEKALADAQRAEVLAKRAWHERARKASDFKSKIPTTPEWSTESDEHFIRPIGQLSRVRVGGTTGRMELHVKKPYARGLRGIESFDKLWLLLAYSRAGTVAKGVCEARLVHRLVSLEQVQRKSEDDVRLMLCACDEENMWLEEMTLDVVDVKPYLAYCDAYVEDKGPGI